MALTLLTGCWEEQMYYNMQGTTPEALALSP